METNPIKNTILESVYNYYTDSSNYINESLEEEAYSVTVDDRMFNEIMDMVANNVFEDVGNGHILIPTMGSYTFHITPAHECYLDDENGNEHEVEIDENRLQQILNAIQEPQYRMVSEGKNNPFTHVEQDPETNYVMFTKKHNVPMEDAMKAAHNTVLKMKDKRRAERDARLTYNPTLQDKRDDPEYMDKVRDYWNDRRENMGEPHGYSTSGTKTLSPLDETDDNSVYDLANDEKGDKAQFAAAGIGYIHEGKLHEAIAKVIREIINNLD